MEKLNAVFLMSCKDFHLLFKSQSSLESHFRVVFHSSHRLQANNLSGSFIAGTIFSLKRSQCCRARQKIIYNRLRAVDWLFKYCFIIHDSRQAIKFPNRAKYLHKVISLNFRYRNKLSRHIKQIQLSHQRHHHRK